MLEVTCAIIQNGQRLLICQRSEAMRLPLKWEFPGGKVENNETTESCIVREIKEELNLDVAVWKALNPVTHHYPEFSIRLYPFVCRLLGGELKLKEHKQALWVARSELLNFDWAAADRPVVDEVVHAAIDGNTFST